MKCVRFSVLLFLAAACGGKVTANDIDAATVFDLDAHWGECCFASGGVPGSCPDDAGVQCVQQPTYDASSDKIAMYYCGLNETTHTTACCGNRGTIPPTEVENVAVDWRCPAFPLGSTFEPPDAGAELATHWGECCYLGQGGLFGSCVAEDIHSNCGEAGPCEQCSISSYCGLGTQYNGEPYQQPSPFRCCGDRYLVSAGYSPIDPTCLPASWDGGL